MTIIERKNKTKFYRIMSDYCDEMSYCRLSECFHFGEDLFAEKTQGIGESFPEVTFLLKV